MARRGRRGADEPRWTAGTRRCGAVSVQPADGPCRVADASPRSRPRSVRAAVRQASGPQTHARVRVDRRRKPRGSARKGAGKSAAARASGSLRRLARRPVQDVRRDAVRAPHVLQRRPRDGGRWRGPAGPGPAPPTLFQHDDRHLARLLESAGGERRDRIPPDELRLRVRRAPQVHPCPFGADRRGLATVSVLRARPRQHRVHGSRRAAPRAEGRPRPVLLSGPTRRSRR